MLKLETEFLFSRIKVETFYEIFLRIESLKIIRELLVYRLEFDGIVWQSQRDHVLFLNHDGNVAPINRDCIRILESREIRLKYEI